MCIKAFTMPFLALGTILAADVSIIDQIVAKVNGEIITSSELSRQKNTIEADLRQRGAKDAQIAEALKEREKDILREKIDQMLLVQKGKEMNANVDQQFSKYQAEMMKQLKLADTEEFARKVREETGTPYEDWRNDIKNNMLTQRVIGQEVQSKINVPTADVQKYYEEHKSEFIREERVFLQEILLKTDGKNEAAVEKKAKDLAARAKKGERFAEMARDNSDAESAQQGGDVGSYKKGELDPTLEKMVFEGGKNFVTDPPLKRPNGFLILKVAEVHAEGQAPFEMVENEIREKLYMPKMAPAVRDYLTKLRQEAFLELRDGYVDTGAAPGKDTSWTDPAQLKPETVSKEELANEKRRKRFLGIPYGKAESIAEKEGEKEPEKGTSISKELQAK